jgi:hypothetical protein
LEFHGAGKVFINGNDDELKDAAEFLLSSSSCRLDMGQSAKKLSKRLFSVKNAADKIITSYQKWKKSY